MNLFGEYVYHHSLLRIVAFDQQGLQEAFAQIQSCRDRGYLLGYVAYEAYYALIDETYRSKTPLLFFECFAHREAFTSLPKTHKIFAPQEVRFVDYESYAQQVEAIKEQILEGNTYQGNLTTCFEFVSTLELEEIFAALLYRQDTPYRAFLDTPYGKIASFSPELFFEIKGGGFILSR
ncbi:hypothetical protein BBW65_01550 [Helicobacter enhydrae]|uniref:Chorismate-utilising enzyme C-terminal domain-containing protein n=1 Tax=Helicobacter enhydrae TaxID=222136 RepID=A0A1B1U4C9_9HELI|nr:chorismate-binding protein [Helicobacter enhydrae]ANV97572.1 hypothetical protein BBW65_01550 [Helicobacter enhydrae]